MKSHLLEAVCAFLFIFSTSCGAALISSKPLGQPDSLSGSQSTLDQILPAQFQLIYGDILICDEDPCISEIPNPAPPIATIFEVEIIGTMSETFVLDSGSDFDAVVALATNGISEPLNYGIESPNGNGEFSVFGTEDSFYGLPVDLSGFNISSFELILNATINSPGENPNGDGMWVDTNFHGTFNVYGEPVPIPPAFYLFGSGILGLMGIARRKTT